MSKKMRHSGNKLILPKQPHNDDFIEIITKVFQYSCWFGVMGSKKLVWKIWSCIVCLVLVCVNVFAIWKVIKALAGWARDTIGHRSVTARLAGTFFYTIATLCLVLSSRLFHKWRELSAFWISVERTIALNIPPDNTLKRRMILVIFVMITFCLLEHVMSMVSLVGIDCPPEYILKKYILLSHGFMVLKREYSDWMPFPILLVSSLATALWNFQDVLIVLISMGLTSRYQRLNQNVAKTCTLEKEESTWDKKTPALRIYNWRRIREAYVKQATLVRKMDDAIGTLIVLSNFCNFYFICLQLFLGITQAKEMTNLRRISFVVSISWLIIRVTSVVLTASDINVQSKKALKYIYHCDRYYNIEMERLQNQLTKDFVALSGMGFFYLNRIILLQMAGAIITYELVIIQFDTGGSSEHSENFTTN